MSSTPDTPPNPNNRSHWVLIVPAPVNEPMVAYSLPDANPHELSSLVSGTPEGVTLDFASFSRYNFIVAVDDFGAIKPLEPNYRAGAMIYEVVREIWSVYPVYGTAVFMGTTAYGDYADVPRSILESAGITLPT